MEERIAEKIEKDVLSPEKKIESNKDVFEFQNSAIETKESDKNDLLRDIHDKGTNINSRREEVVENKNSNQEKNVSVLVKEFFSVGADRTITKLRKLFSKGDINANDVDDFHDSITNKNKGEKR